MKDKLIEGGLKAPFIPEENNKGINEEIKVMLERKIDFNEYIKVFSLFVYS